MSFLRLFVESPLAGAVGWTLLHSLWQGTIISGALAAVLLVVRSARARYVWACAAMLLMLAAFGATLAVVMPEAKHLLSAGSASGLQGSAIAPRMQAGSPTPDTATLVSWLTPFWIAGVLLIYVRRVADCISLQRLRRRGVCSAPEQWEERLAQLSDRLRISRPIQLLESSLAEVPAVVGHLRPLILIPAGLLAGLPPQQVEAILLHELAHIRRHDYLVNIFQRLAEGLLFYHPAIWWISRVMRVERENCCDDLALSISGDSHEYASALAALERRRQNAVEPAVAATGGSLVKRIRRVLYPTKSNAPWAPFVAATMFIVVAAVSVAAWQSPLQDTKRGTGDQSRQVERVRVPEDVMEKYLVRKVPPVYPEVRVEGEVLLRAVIGSDGAMKELRVISGPPMLIQAAMEAARQWRYKPYLVNGSPAEVETELRIPFNVGLKTQGGASSPVVVSTLLPPPPPAPVAQKSDGAVNPISGISGDGKRVQLSQDVMDTLLVHKVRPDYPIIAQQAKIEGTVVLKAVIGREGLVQRLDVISGPPMLTMAAMDAARQRRYKPYFVNGIATEVETTITIPFRLGS